jgi:hypothetical protein
LSDVTPLSRIHISIEHDSLSYDDLDEVISPALAQACGQCVLKRQKKKTQVDTDDLDIASKKLDTTISGRKDLLKEYIDKKR